MGYLLNHVKTLHSKQVILFEMCSRTIKNVLASKLRELKSTEESDYLAVICNELNAFFGVPSTQNISRKLFLKGVSQPVFSIPKNMDSTPTWITLLTKNIPIYFEFTRDPVYNEESFVSKSLNRITFLLPKGRVSILKRVLHLSQIYIYPEVLYSFQNNKLNHVSNPFKPEDIFQVNVIVKLLNIDIISNKFHTFEDQESLYLQELETRISQLGPTSTQIARGFKFSIFYSCFYFIINLIF